jgi:hypothetical protein
LVLRIVSSVIDVPHHGHNGRSRLQQGRIVDEHQPFSHRRLGRLDLHHDSELFGHSLEVLGREHLAFTRQDTPTHQRLDDLRSRLADRVCELTNSATLAQSDNPDLDGRRRLRRRPGLGLWLGLDGLLRLSGCGGLAEGQTEEAGVGLLHARGGRLQCDAQIGSFGQNHLRVDVKLTRQLINTELRHA